MIVCNLRELAYDKDVNVSTISRETGISRTTLSALYKNAGKGVAFSTLNTLCDYFDCGVGEILGWREETT